MQQQQTSSHNETPSTASDDVIPNVLRQLSLVDSPPEPGFNRFTRLACYVAEVPIALVSFVHESP